MTVFRNAQIVTPTLLKKGTVIVEGKLITKILSEGEPLPPFAPNVTVIDCGENYLCPGFVDTHIHGTVAGSLFSSDASEIASATLFLAEHGTTAVLPTSLTSEREKTLEFFRTLSGLVGKNRGSKLLGAHLESNYFHKDFVGAQNPKHLYPPTKADYTEFYETGILRCVSAAPEIPGVLEMARDLSQKGVCLSIAHSGATYREVLAAIDAGFTHVTHIFNALSYLSNCYFYPQIGASEACLLEDAVTVEVICDGKHIPPELIRLMHKIKGNGKIHAVTDAVLAGAPAGFHTLWGQNLLVEDGVGMLPDKTAFFGSVTTQDEELKILVNEAKLNLCDAVQMLTKTPAQTIGEQSLGVIAEGCSADINLLDKDLNVIYTMIDGTVYRNRP